MDFELARENMIKQQVLTEGLSLDGVAKIMADIPRENFLPKELQDLAYCDTSLAIGDRELRSPMLTAKLIDALKVKSTDSVLELGCECGYPVALLARMAKNIELVDYNEDRLTAIKHKLEQIDIHNVEFGNAESLTDKIKDKKKYNCIYISTAIREEDIEESLLGLLDLGGRVVFVVRGSVYDKAYIVTKTSKDTCEKAFLFDVYNK